SRELADQIGLHEGRLDPGVALASTRELDPGALEREQRVVAGRVLPAGARPPPAEERARPGREIARALGEPGGPGGVTLGVCERAGERARGGEVARRGLLHDVVDERLREVAFERARGSLQLREEPRAAAVRDRRAEEALAAERLRRLLRDRGHPRVGP